MSHILRTCSVAILLLSAAPAGAQDISFTELPRDLQLFPRDEHGAAKIVFSGAVHTPGHESVTLEVYRNGELWDTDQVALVYDPPYEAPFHLTGEILAEFVEYDAHLLLDDDLILVRDSLVCGDVLLINGQSNAMTVDYEGLATFQSEWFRSFGTSDPVPGVCAADTSWYLAQGHTHYTSGAVGVWGLCLGTWLVEEYGVPMAILNGAVSGTRIEEHLRDDDNPEAFHTIYGRLLWRAGRAGVRDAVRAMLWHQGESSSSDDWIMYDLRFDDLWNAWHEDYDPIERVYVFQIHPGCGGDHQSELREVQRRLPETFPDIEVMATAALPGHFDGCHYLFDGYRQMALWVYRLVARDLYGSGDVGNITPPNLEVAHYLEPSHDQIRLWFDTEVDWPADTLGAAMEDYFYLDGEWGGIESGYVGADGRSIVLTLEAPSAASTITYLPNCCYNDQPSLTYEGPWIRNPRGVAALSFWEFPISEAGSVPDGRRADGGRADGILFHGSAPNPFRDAAQIRFTLDFAQPTQVAIIGPDGRLVRLLARRVFVPGNHVLGWDGRDETGWPVPSGAYSYLLQIPGSGGASRTGRLVLVR